MELETFFQELLLLDWFRIVFKLTAIMFSVGYLIYSLVYYQQVVKMNRNAMLFYHQLTHPNNPSSPKKPTILAIAILQIVFGVCLLLISVFFL